MSEFETHSEISAGVISVAKLPKFRPLFSKRFARRKEGEKKPDTRRSANLPQGENVLRVSLLFPPFFQTEARFFSSSSSSLASALERDEEEGKREKCRARIIDAAAHFYGNGWNRRTGIESMADEIRIRIGGENKV